MTIQQQLHREVIFEPTKLGPQHSSNLGVPHPEVEQADWHEVKMKKRVCTGPDIQFGNEMMRRSVTFANRVDC